MTFLWARASKHLIPFHHLVSQTIFLKLLASNSQLLLLCRSLRQHNLDSIRKHQLPKKTDHRSLLFNTTDLIYVLIKWLSFIFLNSFQKTELFSFTTPSICQFLSKNWQLRVSRANLSARAHLLIATLQSNVSAATSGLRLDRKLRSLWIGRWSLFLFSPIQTRLLLRGNCWAERKVTGCI